MEIQGRKTFSRKSLASLNFPEFPDFHGIVLCCVLLAAPPAGLQARELSEPLREASALYEVGRLEEARPLALSVATAFPDRLDAWLLLTRIDLDRQDLRQARQWARKAAALSPSHPLVRHYRTLFDEVEHRRGPLSTEILPLPDSDPDVTAERFRRGWFGPGYPILSPPVPGIPATPASRLYPMAASMGVLLEQSRYQQAAEAMTEKKFLKAYLLFTPLVEERPDYGPFRLGKARAALAIGRFKEVVSLVEPMLFHRKLLDRKELVSEAEELYRQARRRIPVRQHDPDFPVLTPR